MKAMTKPLIAQCAKGVLTWMRPSAARRCASSASGRNRPYVPVVLAAPIPYPCACCCARRLYGGCEVRVYLPRIRLRKQGDCFEHAARNALNVQHVNGVRCADRRVGARIIARQSRTTTRRRSPTHGREKEDFALRICRSGHRVRREARVIARLRAQAAATRPIAQSLTAHPGPRAGVRRSGNPRCHCRSEPPRSLAPRLHRSRQPCGPLRSVMPAACSPAVRVRSASRISEAAPTGRTHSEERHHE